MTSFCTDEHVPSVFVTTLQSNGHDVVQATDIFGEGTNDRQLLQHCADDERILITHDKKDFGGRLGETIDHAEIVIYTDPVFLRSDPEGAVRTLERILDQYSPEEISGERAWLDQWRR